MEDVMSTDDAFGPIELSADGRYLIVYEFQFPTMEEFRAMLAELVATAKRAHVRHVLYDARAMNTPFSLTQAFAFGEAFADIVPPSFCVALLVIDDFPNRHFLETVAINRRSHLKY